MELLLFPSNSCPSRNVWGDTVYLNSTVHKHQRIWNDNCSHVPDSGMKIARLWGKSDPDVLKGTPSVEVTGDLAGLLVDSSLPLAL